MPIYDYECASCGTRFERLVRGVAAITCSCGSGDVERLMSVTARPASAGPGPQAAVPAPVTGGCCGGACRSHSH